MFILKKNLFFNKICRFDQKAYKFIFSIKNLIFIIIKFIVLERKNLDSSLSLKFLDFILEFIKFFLGYLTFWFYILRSNGYFENDFFREE
jgi:hypothetical protein